MGGKLYSRESYQGGGGREEKERKEKERLGVKGRTKGKECER